MQDRNYLNLQDADKDRYIYRIISVDRLYELFRHRQNVLVRPSKWDDPFENFILNSPALLPTGEVVTFGFHDDFYSQCWTLQSASDAMWRIYSPKSKGVRIRTNIKNLAESLSGRLGEWGHVQSFIGKVQYLRRSKMAEFANTVLANGLAPHSIARTLLVKRPAFKHEREVRLIYFEKENDKGNELYRYEVDPNQFIDQIMIDPRLSKEKADNLKQEIKQKTKFRGPVKRSLLYAVPEKMIIPVG